MEGDSLLCKDFCQVQLIPTEQAQRGKEQGGIQRSFRESAASQRKAAPSAPADPAPSAVCQPLARGTSTAATSNTATSTGYRGTAGTSPQGEAAGESKSRGRTKREVLTWCHQDHCQAQKAECEQCQRARSILRSRSPLSQSSALA